jgi:hypothetical protein
MEAAAKLTYTAEYDSTSGGKTEKLRIVQKPPKSRYEQGGSIVINDGSKTVVCSDDSSSGKPQCLDAGADSGGGSVASFTQVFNAPTLFAGLSVLAIVPGVKVTESKKTLAGQSLDCVKVDVSSEKKSAESCVTSDGVMGFWDGGDGNTFTLTQFSRSASDSEFTPPSQPVTQQQLLDQATSTTFTVPSITIPPASSGDDSEDTTTTEG